VNAAELRHALGRHCVDGPDGLWVSPDSAASMTEILHVLAAHEAHLGTDVKLTRSSLRGVSQVDDLSLTVDVGAGVTLQALDVQLAAHRVCIGPMSPGARLLTVGEYLESGYAGLHAVENGRLEPWCTRVEAVLADGRLLTTHKSPRGATGPDLGALFLGGFARAGVVVAATVRLRPLPIATQEVAMSFPSARALVATLHAALADGCLPWFARISAGARPTLTAKLQGDHGSVARDLTTINHRGFSRGARPLSPSPLAALPGPEREAAWPSIEAAVEAGHDLELYRVSLATALVRGAVDGAPLESFTGWDQTVAVAAAVDPRRVLGGVQR
jgi:FAD/FMN-containing dehydrogenase